MKSLYVQFPQPGRVEIAEEQLPELQGVQDRVPVERGPHAPQGGAELRQAQGPRP